jgi:hypothetical protein
VRKVNNPFSRFARHDTAKEPKEPEAMNARMLFQVILILGLLAFAARPALAEPPDQTQPTVPFTMEGKPWPEVFEWLTEITGKPVVSSYKPSGKFPCMDLLSREYTIPEVIEIINKALEDESQAQKYYLISRERTFTLVPADEQIDPISLPRVRPEKLKDHADREIVSIVVPLKNLNAEVVAPQVKKLMGQYGDAVPMTHVGINQLILIDTVGNLKSICKMLEEIDHPPNKWQTTGDDLKRLCKLYEEARVPLMRSPDPRRRADLRVGDDRSSVLKWDALIRHCGREAER